MADPLVIPNLAEARDHAGRDLGATAWFEIDQARVDQFAQATGERHWLYVDPERASRESPWKTTVVPGFLLLSLVPDLLPRLLLLGGWKTAVNAGVDACSFARPAPVGSRLRMSARIFRVRSVPGGGARLTFSVAFEVEGAREPACTARVHYAYFR